MLSIARRVKVIFPAFVRANGTVPLLQVQSIPGTQKRHGVLHWKIVEERRKKAVQHKRVKTFQKQIMECKKPTEVLALCRKHNMLQNGDRLNRSALLSRLATVRTSGAWERERDYFMVDPKEPDYSVFYQLVEEVTNDMDKLKLQVDRNGSCTISVMADTMCKFLTNLPDDISEENVEALDLLGNAVAKKATSILKVWNGTWTGPYDVSKFTSNLAAAGVREKGDLFKAAEKWASTENRLSLYHPSNLVHFAWGQAFGGNKSGVELVLKEIERRLEGMPHRKKVAFFPPIGPRKLENYADAKVLYQAIHEAKVEMPEKVSIIFSGERIQRHIDMLKSHSMNAAEVKDEERAEEGDDKERR